MSYAPHPINKASGAIAEAHNKEAPAPFTGKLRETHFLLGPEGLAIYELYRGSPRLVYLRPDEVRELQAMLRWAL